MASLSPVDAALSIGQRIGRYFALVSMIPSLFLVIWTYILIASGAPSGKPAIHNVEVALRHWSLTKVAGIILLSFAVATILHPLQFITTRVLEGYWGTTALAITAMNLRITHHRKRKRDLDKKTDDNLDALREGCLDILRGQRGYNPEWEEEENAVRLDERLENILRSKPGDRLMRYFIASQESLDHANAYPDDAARILPTELGNSLRSFEDSAGKQYGLDAITIAPHLYLLIPDRHRNYLMDAREDMDSTIRICTVGLAATALTIGFLVTRGLWLLWALAPYAVSYLAYKGAISAAQRYGGVVRTAIDLNRFRLYSELGLDMPRDSTEERENNDKLMKMLGGEDTVIRYRPRN
jgi:hypothetical protein